MSNKLKWPLVKLSTLAAKDKNAIVGGPFGSDLVSRDYVPEGVPVVRGGNLPKNSNFSCEDLVFVSERKADSLHLNCAKPGDIVFTQRGTLGQVGIIPKNTPYSRFLISQSQMKMTVDSSMANAMYLYYYFRLPSTVSYIENHALQSGVPHINLGILRKFDVVYPLLPIQQKIAAVLSSYDDLIENNKRRIALLEKMAEEIYRDWFVRLRFPGHGSVKVVKGVPEGWDEIRFSEIYDIAYGKNLPTDNLIQDGKYEVYGAGDIIGSFNSYNCKEKVTLITCRGNGSGTVWHTRSAPSFVTNNSFMITQKNKSLRYHYYFVYLHMKFSPIEQSIGGSAQPQITIDSLSKVKIFRYPDALIQKFSDLIETLDDMRTQLIMTVSILDKTRDRLLPRLISGKMLVENLDIQFPPSMQDEASS